MRLTSSCSKVLTLSGLLAIAGIGCSHIAQVSFNPEQMLRQSGQISCPQPQSQLESFQILGSRDWEKGKSVVYQAVCRSSNSQKPDLDIVGYAMFVREGLNWSLGASGSTGRPANDASSKKLADIVVSQSSNQGKPYAAVHGRILNSQVAAIEAQFSNGKTLQDNIFALIATDAIQVCQVKFLNIDGKVLQTHRPGSEAKTPVCST